MKFLMFILLALPFTTSASLVQFADSEWSFSEKTIEAALSNIGHRPLTRADALKKLKAANVHFDSEAFADELDEEMVNNILAAIGLLPFKPYFFFPPLIIKKSSVPIFHAEFRSVRDEEGSRVHQIVLSDLWMGMRPLMRTGAFLHELGHLVGNLAADVDDSKRWQNIDGGWDFDLIWATPRHRDGYVSGYAMTNPSEDWAESIVSFLIIPDILKEISQNKYDFIKSIITDSYRVRPSMIRDHFSKKDLRRAKSIHAYKSCIELLTKSKELKDLCTAQALFDGPETNVFLKKKLGPDSFSFFLGIAARTIQDR